MNLKDKMEVLNETSKGIQKIKPILKRLFSPQPTKDQVDVELYADEKKIELIRNNPDIDIEYNNGQMTARRRTPEVLAYRAEQRQLNESIRQEDNLENVLEIAADEMPKDDQTVSDESVDEDWLNRFFSIAKDISTEQMQYVWGKILAGEIAQPGSFSLRTLDVVRNMTMREAEEFQRIAPFIICAGENCFITSNREILSLFNISSSSVITLAECGLMNSQGELTIDISLENQDRTVFYNKGNTIIIQNDSEIPIKETIRVFKLTQAGCELYKILDFYANRDYNLQFAKELYSKAKSKATVSIYNTEYIFKKSISYTSIPIKVFSKQNETNNM